MKLTTRLFFYALVLSCLASSCAPFRPEAVSFGSAKDNPAAKTANGLTYAVKPLHPDTARTAFFGKKDIESLNINSYLLQVSNQSQETFQFDASGIQGGTSTQQVFRDTRDPQALTLVATLTGTGIAGLLLNFNPAVLAPLLVADAALFTAQGINNGRRKRHYWEQAPPESAITPGADKNIFFFVNAEADTENSKVVLKGNKGSQVAIDVPLHPYQPKLVYINSVTAVRAKEGDTFQSIAQQAGTDIENLARYNDLGQEQLQQGPLPGSPVFLSIKKKKADTDSHTIKAGESMWAVSQAYGIQLDKLYALNSMPPGSEPKAGETLNLRSKRATPPALR